MSSDSKVSEAARLLEEPGAAFHLAGISGSGMIGIARLLLDRGCAVSGSDLRKGSQIPDMEKLGLKFFHEHADANLGKARALVYSSAVRPDNAERKAAAERGIPEFKRAEMLAALCRGRKLNVVSGTHGKTTTALLLAQIFKSDGRDPGYYIGADVPSLPSSAAWGSGREMVIEADESDGTLDCYDPSSVLILNIEGDHLDHYGDLEHIRNAFVQLARKAKDEVVVCKDDPVCRRMASELPGIVTYSINEAADYQADGIRLEAGGSVFRVRERGTELGELRLTLPGRHNISNALGALALARLTGVDFDACRKALGSVRGAGRRFDILYADEDYMVVDDYAHHPSEIRATLAAAGSYGKKRILAAFQPHRYSRSYHLKNEFAGAFTAADRVFLTDIYSAGEAPIEGVSGPAFAEAVRQGEGGRVAYSETLKDLKTELSVNLEPGDCVLTMGAGNIHEVAEELSRDLRLFKMIGSLAGEQSVLKAYEPMSRHTTLRVGGPAQIWFEPSDETVLSKVAVFCRREGVPVTLVGRGSNLLVLDHGIRGVCIHLGRPEFSRIRIEGESIYAGAGARLKQIVYEARKACLGGLEFMEGIPGNLGGALRMNAGAMQSSLFEMVERVRYLNPEGKVCEAPREEIDVRYRSVPFLESSIALGAWLKGVPKEGAAIAETLNSFSQKRWSSQPAAPSAGCTFKNPGQIPAGRLIDELGLKDTCCGGARISAVHANFIVNDGKATGSDVLRLIETVKRKAKAERGIDLELEVIVLGE
ncbi:MAG: UDP-N-acetylmuramate--L-alanine ligase [Methylacidiphilales bacterium]|nr:UDP-N-acetylmuramate--L-alanine ligase [Candidatus Methylacidiphilales bacterium]